MKLFILVTNTTRKTMTIEFGKLPSHRWHPNLYGGCGVSKNY